MEQERERCSPATIYKESTCHKIKEKSGGCKKRKLSQKAIKEVAEWQKRGK